MVENSFCNLSIIFSVVEFPSFNKIIFGGEPFSVDKSMKSKSNVTIQ
jgi:hypothetical protein